MNAPEENYELKLLSRPRERISLAIPKDTVESLERVAEYRQMSLDALLKFYIGRGLRQDLARLFSNLIIEATDRVLSRHFSSSEEEDLVLQEIRKEIDRL
jgi:hypothetical protein